MLNFEFPLSKSYKSIENISLVLTASLKTQNMYIWKN